jgi:hypothetical protein
MVQFSHPLVLALPSLYLAMRMSKVVLGCHYGCALFVLMPLDTFWTFWLNHSRWPLFSYNDFLALGQLGLRWLKKDLLPLGLDHVHIHREWVLIELNLWTFCKFESCFVYGQLNLLMENIAIVSSMRIRIMPFTISMPFELFQRQHDIITWQFNLFLLQQVIKKSYHT